MIRFAKSQIYPIGVDVGHDSVKMMQLERAGDHLAVLAAARVPLPTNVRGDPALRLNAAVAAVRTLLRRGGPFRGRQVVTSLPRESLHTRNVRIAHTSPADLVAAVREEVAATLPFAWDAAVTHCLPAGEVRQGGEPRQEVVFLAADRTAVDQYVKAVAETGAELVALDAEPMALYRTVDRFVRRQDDRRDVNVLVDVGWERTHVVMGRGWDVQVVKSINIAARHFQEAVGRKLDVTADEAQSLRRRLNQPGQPVDDHDPVRQAAVDATRSVMEDLGREIGLCLQYHAVTFRGQRQGVAKIVGGESTDLQLHAVLNRSLPIAAQIGRPLFSVDSSRMPESERRGPMSEWAMAFGLALKTIDDRFGPRDGKPRDAAAPGEVAGFPVNPAPEVAHA